MRRIALLVVVLIALLFLWIFEARHFSLLLDRFGTAELESRAIDHIEYDGSESAGVSEIAGSPFSTQGVNNKPFPLTLEADPQKHFVISTNGKSFCSVVYRHAANFKSFRTRAITWHWTFGEAGSAGRRHSRSIS